MIQSCYINRGTTFCKIFADRATIYKLPARFRQSQCIPAHEKPFFHCTYGIHENKSLA